MNGDGLCIHAAECGLFCKNVCTVKEIAEKNCGGPILMTTTGDCKICGKENVKVFSVNEWITACRECWFFMILPRKK